MIGLDTNILVRYLAQDDPVQSPKATELIERQLTEENPGFVSVVAMVETVWVLDRAYVLRTMPSPPRSSGHFGLTFSLWKAIRKSLPP
jgi:predicted nucleic-acid-binding protein